MKQIIVSEITDEPHHRREVAVNLSGLQILQPASIYGKNERNPFNFPQEISPRTTGLQSMPPQHFEFNVPAKPELLTQQASPELSKTINTDLLETKSIEKTDNITTKTFQHSNKPKSIPGSELGNDASILLDVAGTPKDTSTSTKKTSGNFQFKGSLCSCILPPKHVPNILSGTSPKSVSLPPSPEILNTNASKECDASKKKDKLETSKSPTIDSMKAISTRKVIRVCQCLKESKAGSQPDLNALRNSLQSEIEKFYAIFKPAVGNASVGAIFNAIDSFKLQLTNLSLSKQDAAEKSADKLVNNINTLLKTILCQRTCSNNCILDINTPLNCITEACDKFCKNIRETFHQASSEKAFPISTFLCVCDDLKAEIKQCLEQPVTFIDQPESLDGENNNAFSNIGNGNIKGRPPFDFDSENKTPPNSDNVNSTFALNQKRVRWSFENRECPGVTTIVISESKLCPNQTLEDVSLSIRESCGENSDRDKMTVLTAESL